MIAQNKASIPGNNDLDAVAQWAAWLQGKVAMIFSWPPTGRISSNYAQRDKAINFIPQSSIADKVGYAVVPGGNGEMASGYVNALAAGSNNEEAAYLFMQWVSARRSRWCARCFPTRCAIPTACRPTRPRSIGRSGPPRRTI